MKFSLPLLILMTLFSCCNMNSQDPTRFNDAIQKFSTLPVVTDKNMVVFTGSSSIRMWETLAEDCSGKTVVNTGFGGSHMSDLLYFLKETVLTFNPTDVYIYEGDNDIAADKKPADIMATTKKVVEQLLAFNEHMNIHFISAKPSPSRWSYKDNYEAFNDLLKAYCAGQKQLSYIDVWTPMLNERGLPIANIFIADSLHMNREGYLLWKDIMCGGE